MILTDTLILDAPKFTREGYLAVRARAAKSGVYDYLGSEVDPEGKRFKAQDTVKVYRPATEVFDSRSVHSFIMKPITDDHPSEPVTAANWADKAKGLIAGAMRDGDYLAFDLVMMDKALIEKVQSGKRELSNGYSVELEFGDGVAPDGTAYHATQKQISGNHVAVVKTGRAGSECRIADSAALCDSAAIDFARELLDGERKVMKTILIDGHSVEVSDAAEIAVAGLVKQLNDSKSAHTALLASSTTDAAKLATDLAAKDAKIATLDAEVATLKAGQLTGDKLDAAVAERSKLISDAKAIGGETLDVKGTNDDIKKRAVLVKLGDAYKDRDKAFFDAAFELQVVGLGDTDSVRNHLRQQPQRHTGDAYTGEVKAFKDSVNDLNAWRDAKTA